MDVEDTRGLVPSSSSVSSLIGLSPFAWCRISHVVYVYSKAVFVDVVIQLAAIKQAFIKKI